MTKYYQNEEEEEKKKKKRIIPIVIIIILLIIIGGLVTYFVYTGSNSNGVQGEYIADNAQGMDFEDNDENNQTVKFIKSVTMPGWETITLEAGTINQVVDFYNPDANSGSFHMTFELKLKNGESLYKSGLVKAGDHVRNITLNRALAAGTYEAVVHIQPYTADEKMTAKNNADVNVTLIVQ